VIISKEMLDDGRVRWGVCQKQIQESNPGHIDEGTNALTTPSSPKDRNLSDSTPVHKPPNNPQVWLLGRDQGDQVPLVFLENKS